VAFVREHGLQAAASVVQTDGQPFNADSRGGPWASPMRSDRPFAASFPNMNRGVYTTIVKGMRDALFDRDSSPGASPEDLFTLAIPALVVPGRDASHATSAARYLEECLAKSQYWDAPPEAQTEAAATPRLLQFLDAAR
jgi:hypothetical protein